MLLSCVPFALGSDVLPRTMSPLWFSIGKPLSTNCLLVRSAPLWWSFLSPGSPLFLGGDALAARLCCWLGPGVVSYQWAGGCIGWSRNLWLGSASGRDQAVRLPVP
jgi:hypothetical protein